MARKLSRRRQGNHIGRRALSPEIRGNNLISGTLFRIQQFARLLWARAALISALAFLAPLAAPLLSSLLPDWILAKMLEETVRSLLDILANSMLAVTTFSLTIMVTAHLAADQGASPRGHRLLQEDGSTQTVLATFVGSFVYALVSIVLLQTGFAPETSFSGYYLMTLVVFAIVILTILRWIGRLASLGSIEATILTAETSARDTLSTRNASPFLGGRRLVPGSVPADAHSLTCNHGGYVRHIDTKRLSELAGERGGEVFVKAVPGDFVGEGDTLAHVTIEDLTDEDEKDLCRCYTIGTSRSFEQDPTFALRVLTDIAERALSSGINDPGTARDVTGRLALLISDFEGEIEPDNPAGPLVYVPELDRTSLMLETLDPIARDGRSFVEVQIDLQMALARLACHRDEGMARAARILSARALAYAQDGILIEEDKRRIADAGPDP